MSHCSAAVHGFQRRVEEGVTMATQCMCSQREKFSWTRRV